MKYVFGLLLITFLFSGCSAIQTQIESDAILDRLQQSNLIDITADEVYTEFVATFDADITTDSGLKRAQNSLTHTRELIALHNQEITEYTNTSPEFASSQYSVAVDGLNECYSEIYSINSQKLAILDEYELYLERQEYVNTWDQNDFELTQLIEEYSYETNYDDALLIVDDMKNIIASMILLGEKSNEIIYYESEIDLADWLNAYSDLLDEAIDNFYTSDDSVQYNNFLKNATKVDRMYQDALVKYYDENVQWYSDNIDEKVLIHDRHISEKERICQKAMNYISNTYDVTFI